MADAGAVFLGRNTSSSTLPHTTHGYTTLPRHYPSPQPTQTACQVKRSNWSPPMDTGLWALADRMRARVQTELHGPVRERLDAELAYFDAVTAVSGRLYPVPKVGRHGLGRSAPPLGVCVGMGRDGDGPGLWVRGCRRWA